MKRFFRFLYLQLLRQRGSPEYVARGVALGLAVGFAIPFGLQILVVLPLAFLLRAAKVAACAFTFVTNQLTIIVIYPLQCVLGAWVIGGGQSAGIRTQIQHFTANPGWETLLSLGPRIAAAFFVGGAILAAAAAVPGYFIALHLVRGYRARRARRAAAGNIPPAGL